MLIYSFNIAVLANCTAYEKWQALRFIQNRRNLNKDRFHSCVHIYLLQKVVLTSVNRGSDTRCRMMVRYTPPSTQKLPLAQHMTEERDVS